MFRSASASVPGTSNRPEYEIFLRGLAQQWRPRKKQNLAQR